MGLLLWLPSHRWYRNGRNYTRFTISLSVLRRIVGVSRLLSHNPRQTAARNPRRVGIVNVVERYAIVSQTNIADVHKNSVDWKCGLDVAPNCTRSHSIAHHFHSARGCAGESVGSGSGLATMTRLAGSADRIPNWMASRSHFKRLQGLPSSTKVSPMHRDRTPPVQPHSRDDRIGYLPPSRRKAWLADGGASILTRSLPRAAWSPREGSARGCPPQIECLPIMPHIHPFPLRVRSLHSHR